MATLGKALAIAAKGFENVKDKGDHPYFMHCMRVMNNLHSTDEEVNIAAVLHDCVEDGVTSMELLHAEGFSFRVLVILDLLTHNKDTHTYDEYIQRIASNPDAVKIKLADLKDNTDVTRLKGLTKKDLDRMTKYFRAFQYLSKI